MNTTLYVGIDVSSKSNVVYLMLPNGDKHSNFSVANSHEGSTQLVKRILSALTSHSLDTVLIGLEATSVYGDNLVYFLREDATLAPFNRKIHVLNPRTLITGLQTLLSKRRPNTFPQLLKKHRKHPKFLKIP